MLENEIKSSPIEEIHSLNDAKFVNFAGWSMPIQFPDGIINEHISTRSSCGLFDISHMGQILIDGEESRLLLEKITPTDISKIQTGKVRYSFLLNNEGGIIDDLMITNEGDCFYLVVNASRINEDLEEINKASKSFSKINIKHLQQNGMIALQGPKAKDVISSFFKEIDDSFFFMSFKKITLNGDEVRVSRIGYTGEDGFEISSTKKTILELTKFFLNDERVTLCGLGARDTLRLEAGLSLYGQELTENINPYEAGLGWTIHLENNHNFLGREALTLISSKKTKKKLVGIEIQGKAIARKGCQIYVGNKPIGEVTSGTWSPTLQKPIALGYVEYEYSNLKQEVQILIRDKLFEGIICKKKFLQ